MHRYKLHIYYLLSLSALLLLPLRAPAQNSAWNGGNTAKNSAVQKAEKTKHKLKDFKEHLEKNGLDTNYRHAFLLGGKLNSDGWSGCAYIMKKRSYKLSNFWQMSFSEIKHEKQTKQQGSGGAKLPPSAPGQPYVFGKINNLYTLQVGFGKEQLLLPAVMDGNLSLSFRYSCGISLAMLKPYYLKLIYTDNINNQDTAHLEQHKYNRADSTYFLNTNTVYGAAKWSRGLSEIEYVPGGFFETAFAILPGKNKFFIQVITLGINGAFYAKPLAIMADQKAYPWQVSLFAGLALGKRWR